MFCHRTKKVHVIYDLKGSTRGRQATEAEKASSKTVVLKDKDFLNRGRKLYMDTQSSLTFILQIETDADFLERHQIMDYSLLIGIHHLKLDFDEEEFKKSATNTNVRSSTSCFQKDFGGILSRTLDGKAQPEIYYVGIIDVLQVYTLFKLMETQFLSLGADKNTISAVDSQMYAVRFVNFVQKAVNTASIGRITAEQQKQESREDKRPTSKVLQKSGSSPHHDDHHHHNGNSSSTNHGKPNHHPNIDKETNYEYID
eukprot:TRINITY_DN20121_c0_g1_i1.p1 TRINITY_DN20121_c0_g1~~TRINITY_DN20121_c0_g1_i1.p1  ORF type:complete len:256 (-),score=56.59 TRINITY_DN20121_c0_g1_i1:3-770(-)